MADPLIDLRDLESHRNALFRFAMVQLRDETLAEDCVQETLSAAIQNASRFAGGSSIRTWLVGILKHKILDHFRKAARQQTVSFSADEASLDEFDHLFASDGHFAVAPAAWADPEQALSEREFFEVLEGCLERLPKTTALVFKMREVMGVEVDEICSELSITANYCWVLIYRARMSLRACLEQRWFAAHGRVRAQ